MRIFDRNKKKKTAEEDVFTPMAEDPAVSQTPVSSRRSGGQRHTHVFQFIFGGFMIFLLGVFVGFQLHYQPQMESDAQVGTQRYEIPIDDDDGVQGPADALVVIVEFTDYQCPYCQRYYNDTFHQILSTYGDQIRYVVKDLPLVSIHPNAAPAAVAAHCAAEQGAFWPYHDLLFTQPYGLGDEAYQTYAQTLQLDMTAFNECLDSGRYDKLVLEDTNVLEKINAPISTPTFFINGQYLAGAQPFSVFAGIIDAELAKDGE